MTFKNVTKPCAWVRNPQFWSCSHPHFLGEGHPPPSSVAILNSGIQWALNLKSAWKNELMRMISIFQKISKSGATAARAHLLTFYAPARLNRYPRITDAGGHGNIIFMPPNFWPEGASFPWLCFSWTLFRAFRTHLYSVPFSQLVSDILGQCSGRSRHK